MKFKFRRYLGGYTVWQEGQQLGYVEHLGNWATWQNRDEAQHTLPEINARTRQAAAQWLYEQKTKEAELTK
jgi:hypothetical protein